MISCNVIKDLLPLYIDDVCSEDSRQMVEKHLRECRDCRREAELMKKDVIASDTDITGSEIDLLKEGKKSIEEKAELAFKRKLIFIDLVLNIIVLLAGVCGIMYQKMQGGTIRREALFGFLCFPLGLIMMFTIMDIAYFVYLYLKKEPFITEAMACSSMCIKCMMLTLAVVLLIFGDFEGLSEIIALFFS